jgi:hypothetical protein
MFEYILYIIITPVKGSKERVYLSRLFHTLPKFSAMLYPFSKAIFNRAADAGGIVTQNIFVRRGLGREPQQAENTPNPH